MRERRRRLIVAALAWLASLAVSAPTVASARPTAPDQRDGVALLDELLEVVRAVDAGRRFLDTYVDADGRVVRHDQDGDTVSEGQAYAIALWVAHTHASRARASWPANAKLSCEGTRQDARAARIP